MLKSIAPLLIVLLVSVASGCGLMFNSNPQVIEVTSDPPGATVKVDGEERGTTPIELSLPVEKDYEVTVEAAGYPPETRIIEYSVSAGFIVLDVLFGLVPLIVDLATDSLHHLEPEDGMHFQFAEVKEPEPTAPQPGFEMDMNNRQPGFGNDNQDEGGAGGTNTGGTSQHCCVNGAFYSCPDIAAVKQCAPPELANCMMSCDMMDMGCPEECLQTYPPDPSSCERDPSQDATCK